MYNKGNKNFNQALAILSTLFFIWGLITVLNFMMVEKFMVLFTIQNPYILNTSFFGAYLLVSYPAGKLIDKIGYKNSMVTGILVSAVGCFIFCPSAAYQSYSLLLISLFVLGSGIAILQVSANPYVALLGPRGLGASKLTFVQAFNSLGTFLAPLLAAGLFMKIAGFTEESLLLMPSEEKLQAIIDYVQMPYLILGIALIILALFISFSEIPILDTSEFKPLLLTETPPKKYLLQVPHIWMGALAIFLYVGSEVSIGQYLVNKSTNTASYDFLIRLYLGAAMMGRFLGWILLRYIGPRKSITLFSGSAILLLIIYFLFNTTAIGLTAIGLIGFSNSILFPCIFTLGIDGMGKYSEEASSILNMAIIGGALLPFLFVSLPGTLGFLLPMLSYVFIIYYGLKGSKYLKRTNFY